MPENTITAKVKFYFNSNLVELKTIINLDFIIKNNISFSKLAVLKQLAKINHIDIKTNLYCQLVKQTIAYSNPTGFAVQFCQDGKFNFFGFKCLNEEDEICTEILTIIRHNLKIEALDDINGLEQTLLDICDAFQKKSYDHNKNLSTLH